MSAPARANIGRIIILHGLENYEHLERPDFEIVYFLGQNIRDQEVSPANPFRRKAEREQSLVGNSSIITILLLPGCSCIRCNHDRANKGLDNTQA